jgi:hypothetical protein
MSKWPRPADDVDVADIWDTSWANLAAWLSGPRGRKGVLAAGLSVLTAAAATVVLLPADPASAATRVAVARNAEVYLPDGTHHAAAEGEVLARGAELHTGQDGGARLDTAGRRTSVGALSTLRVQDGVRETLSRGLAMVDARDGAHLDLSTPAGRVATPHGAVARVEEGLLTRVAVYDGTVTLHPAGRTSSTSVSALHQVKVQPQALPDRVTPLQLRPTAEHDAWERAVAAGLVSADSQLNDLASGLQTQEGAKVFTTAPAAYRTGSLPAAGAARGEEALAIAVAVAAGKDDALDQVRTYRSELGSWGVVAALVGARLDRVSAVLDAALAPPGAAGGPTVVDAGGPQLLPAPQPATTPAPGTSATPSPTRPTTGSTTPGTPRPPVTASPTPGLVGGLVNTVLALVSPTPSPAARVQQTTAPLLPLPLPTKGPCLLGSVLC